MTQGDKAYKRFSDALMTYSGPVNDKTIERLAKGALVDIAQTRAGLDDPEVKKRIAATRALGGTMKITGTPTFVIGDKIIRGYIPKDQMAEVVLTHGITWAALCTTRRQDEGPNEQKNQ